jgi:uncharacterized caspase-like protein
LLCLGFGFFSAQAQAPLDIRIALVIGNAAYTQVTPLDNPGNDAKAIAQALHGLGFTVVELRDATRQQMTDALEQVRKSLHGQQALGMLYYAGHGLQLDWRNYMLPVDARLTRAADLSQQALDIGVVVNTFKNAGTRMNIVVLDACRDNPFGSTGAAGRGLAPMDAPPGTFLAYATQPGNVAEDGEASAGNGPYAQFLSAELRRPFARVEDVFKRVRLQVRQKTEGRQIPWESTSLEEDFMFNDGTRHTVAAADLQEFAAEAKRKEQQLQQQVSAAHERERQLAQALERERQAQAHERAHALAQEQVREQERQRVLAQALARVREEEVRRQRQAEQLAEEAQRRARMQVLSRAQQREQQFAAEKAEWDRIRDAKAAEPVYAYLVKYPNGSVSELAHAKLEQLDKPKIQPVPDQSGQVQPFEAKRFVLGDSYQFVVRDLLTKVEEDRPTFRVVAADAETAEFNQGYKVTQAGAIIRTIAGATLDPYQQWIPSGEYQVGKRWSTRSTMTPVSGRPLWVELTGKVVARETITVPAGSFDTYKMEMEQTAQDGTRLKITYWGQPDWGVAIKQIRELRDTRGNYSGQMYEMLSRKRGP